MRYVTRVVATVTELCNIKAEIARVDALIARHPEYESLLLDRDSLIKQQERIFSSLANEEIDSVMKNNRRKRRGLFGRDLRLDPCPKCKEGEMHYRVMASSHVFVCDRCDWVDWKR